LLTQPHFPRIAASKRPDLGSEAEKNMKPKSILVSEQRSTPSSGNPTHSVGDRPGFVDVVKLLRRNLGERGVWHLASVVPPGGKRNGPRCRGPRL